MSDTIKISDDMTRYLSNIRLNGLTKRELFAAMAMQGLVTYNGANAFAKDQIALATLIADALLAKLAEK